MRLAAFLFGLPGKRQSEFEKKHLIENECHVEHTAFSINGEVCIAMYVHGKPLMLYRGIEVAKLIYI